MRKLWSFFVILTLLLMVRVGISAEVKGDIDAGRTIYKRKCIACHGKSGEGLGPRSKMPNFKDAKRMSTKTDEELFTKITKGGRGSGMPSFKSVINEQDIWNVIAYIRTFSEK